MPSIQAEASPRRPIRRMIRTRRSTRAIDAAISDVPSGKSSSTNTISHPIPARLRATRSTNRSTFGASLKVGATTESSIGRPSSVAATPFGLAARTLEL